ncbi:hypothetical protein V502_05236 [Pseudogymnoascus sp. VKM F-4520 (FW-2644)]|nr:hypothetical protein V502_05236 [Pseudogymnoascus sp. VKM F-4520 (FW-2644)]
MWFSPPSVILSILYALPLALSAPADAPATTTLLSVTRTLSPTFPLQTPNTSTYPGADRRGDDESENMAKIEPLNSEPSQTLTDFVPAPTGPNGKAQHWYIVTYWSCVLVLPALFSLLSTLLLLYFGGMQVWGGGLKQKTL